MAKYLGPRSRLSRRLGTDLLLKSGVRDHKSKCKADKAPGQFSKFGRLSNYGVQLRAKQVLRRLYGVLERQFINYYKKALKQKGSTGENLLQLLERRLDNVVYRMGFASTRAEARQLVSHRAIVINHKIVNIPSYQVSPGEMITIRDAAKKQLRVQAALAFAEQRKKVEWVDVDPRKMEGVFKTVPARSELSSDLEEQLVVELYSR